MTIATSSTGTPNTGIYAIASDGSDAFSLDAARRAGVAQPDHPTNEVCQALENAGIPNEAILRSIVGPTGFPLNNLQISNIALVNDLVINQNRHAVVCEINGSSDDGYLVGRLFVDYDPVVEQANSYNFETMHQIVKQYINDNFKAFYEPLVGKVPFQNVARFLPCKLVPLMARPCPEHS